MRYPAREIKRTPMERVHIRISELEQRFEELESRVSFPARVARGIVRGVFSGFFPLKHFVMLTTGMSIALLLVKLAEKHLP